MVERAGVGQSNQVGVSIVTSAARLARIIKSARDIMRKDKGMNGDLDRLPQLTWLMFLKFLDDVERIREAETATAGKTYSPLVDSPYRWRDWASNLGGITGDALTSFVNNDEAKRPDGSKGPGLLAYLRGLQSKNGRESRDVISNVFRGVNNRMLNGYLFRDVINKIDEINFSSSKEIHELSFLYESLLKELRDAAGDSGEFYTPRPVVRFMVRMINPRLGEVVLDPAAGTGGFLVESFLHIQKQCRATEDFERLQMGSIVGVEAKSLPYLLCQMNLLLHGLEFPDIDPLNALRHPLNEIGDDDRVDAILTNPPFGGEEEAGIQSNFPEDKRTNETALLFLQLVMRRLRRFQRGQKAGRCAIIVPDGTLFSEGVGERIKEDLLRDFNLHTIVRLPEGVFSPYTDIKTNLMFFEAPGPTKEVWYYELPLPIGRKKYTKTHPLKDEEFESIIQWWRNRKENSHSWRVDSTQVAENSYNLDLYNPHPPQGESVKSPEELSKQIELIEPTVATNLNKVKGLLEHILSSKVPFFKCEVGDVLVPADRSEEVNPAKSFRQIGVKLWGEGAYEREPITGINTKYKMLSRVQAGDLIVNKIWARHGSIAVVPRELDGCYASSEFLIFSPVEEKLDPRWFHWYSKTTTFWNKCYEKSHGTSGKNRIRPEKFLSIVINLPKREEQTQLLNHFEEFASLTGTFEGLGGILKDLRTSTLNRTFAHS